MTRIAVRTQATITKKLESMTIQYIKVSTNCCYLLIMARLPILSIKRPRKGDTKAEIKKGKEYRAPARLSSMFHSLVSMVYVLAE